MKSERAHKICETIYQATQALASSISTSYGPKGLDKMMIKDNKSVVTNDGATILSYYKTHPVHKILSSVSATQDANCGDGTTSVVLLACCLLESLTKLVNRGIHPSKIVDALEISKKMAVKYINSIKTQIDEKEFVNVALTALSSKIASRSLKMATIAVEALRDHKKEDLKIIKRTGGNIDDIEMYRSILINSKAEIPGGRHKLLILQCCISPPKTNMDSKILINDYALMEKFVREEREYVINLIKKIRKSGATLLVIQKSLLRESCSDLARHFFKKLGIHVIDNVDRKEVEYLSKTMGVSPISDLDLIEEAGAVELVNLSIKDKNDAGRFSNGRLGVPLDIEVRENDGMVEILNYGCSIVVSGCDEMVVDEAARSLNDAFGVVQSLKLEPSIVPGGGSVETGIAVLLEGYTGPHSLIVNEISKGFISMPYFLAQNAGVCPVEVVSQLKKNITINRNLGISLKSGLIADMVNDDRIIQPAANSESMVLLAIEAVQMMIKIDDILPTKQ